MTLHTGRRGEGSFSGRAPTARERVAIAGVVWLLLAAASFALAFAHAWRWSLSDNQFIFYWNPARGFRQLLTVWDPRQDLGGSSEGFAPIVFLFTWSLHSLGAAPWLVQRIFLASLLTIGASGTALVARWFLPQSRLGQLVAGVWFLASPFTVGFLRPSWLFLNAALAPWLLLALLHGITSPARWRWAGIASLLLAVSGTLNVPGLLFACLPLIPAALALLLAHRASVRAVTGWIVRVGALTVAIMLPAIARLAFVAPQLGRNLASSESAIAVSQSSSWPETLRGLGGWLLYWNPRGPLLFPYLFRYFANEAIVLLTFVPVVAATLVIAFARERFRLLFAAVLLISAGVMVGAYPPQRPSPAGRALLYVYRVFPATFAFRNTYKAGAGLVLATAVLLGIGAHRLIVEGRTHRVRLVLTGLVVAAAVVASSAPLWSGSAFSGSDRMRGNVPPYWTSAIRWLDAQPGRGRVLIVPSGPSPDYRWGQVSGGDMFPALMNRPFMFASALSASSPDASNAIDGLDAILTDESYTPGTFSLVARRLGIGYLLIRNDLDWQSIDTPRPALLQSIRTDPTLIRVATFGRSGQNVVGASDNSALARVERDLPPVEVFAIPGQTDPVRAVSASPSLLVSGDGSAWASLARSGQLELMEPIRYTGRLNQGSLRAELQAGAGLTVTDTNRRRSTPFGVAGPTLSSSDTGRINNLFGKVASQSVATYGAAVSITEVGPPQLFMNGPEHRPAAAFDGDPSTSWLTGLLSPAHQASLEVRLARPATVSSITVTPASPPGGRAVKGVALVFPDGSSVPIDLTAGTGTATFSPRTSDRFRIAVTSVAGLGTGPYGISEVRIPGLDLVERIQLPDDAFLTSSGDPVTKSLLAGAPLSYSFQRLSANGQESSLRRRFRVPSKRTFVASGVLRLGPGTPDTARTAVTAGPFEGQCRFDLASLDGRALGLALQGPAAALGAGVQVTLCQPLSLAPGWHDFLAAPSIPLDSLVLTATDGRPARQAEPEAVQVLRSTQTSFSVRVTGAPGATLILGQSASPHWRASTPAGSLGKAEELDAQAAWHLNFTGTAVVSVTNNAQGPYAWTLWISLVAAIVAAILAVANPRPAAARALPRVRTQSIRGDIALDVAAVAFAFAVEGWWLAVLVAATGLALRRRSVAARAVCACAALSIAAAALLTVPPFGPRLTPIWPGWPSARRAAQVAALVGAGLLTAAIAGFARSVWRQELRSTDASPSADVDQARSP